MTILSINPYGYLVAIIIAAGVIMFYLLKKGLVERPGSQAEYEPTTRKEFEKSFAIPEDKMDAIIKHMNANCVELPGHEYEYSEIRKRQAKLRDNAIKFGRYVAETCGKPDFDIELGYEVFCGHAIEEKPIATEVTTNENYFIELNDEYEVIRDTINSMYVEIGRLSNLAGRELEIKALHDEITPLAARKDEILKILKGE